MVTHTIIGVEDEQTQLRVAVQFTNGASVSVREWVVSGANGMDTLAANVKAHTALLEGTDQLRTALVSAVGKPVPATVAPSPDPLQPARDAYQSALRKLKALESAVASGLIKPDDAGFLAAQAAAKAAFAPELL